ncbi:MAG: TetR family transcriptional regulator [Oligoflexia bacterium]|nr:TetR family transcriptional regulator [Oligoflexia bacterium]
MSRNVTKPDANERDKTRTLLLKAGIALFSRKGLDGTTVKDLAREADVNISLVSYHFGGKEGLYRACVETFGSERRMVYEEILQPARSAEEHRLRLGLFVRSLLEFHANHAEVARMINRECDSEIQLTRDIFEKTFLRIFKSLEGFFRSAHKAGYLRKEIDPHEYAGLLLGALGSVTRTDFLNKRYFNHSIQDPRYRERLAEQVLAIYADGAFAPGAIKRSTKK